MSSFAILVAMPNVDTYLINPSKEINLVRSTAKKAKAESFSALVNIL